MVRNQSEPDDIREETKSTVVTLWVPHKLPRVMPLTVWLLHEVVYGFFQTWLFAHQTRSTNGQKLIKEFISFQVDMIDKYREVWNNTPCLRACYKRLNVAPQMWHLKLLLLRLDGGACPCIHGDGIICPCLSVGVVQNFSANAVTTITGLLAACEASTKVLLWSKYFKILWKCLIHSMLLRIFVTSTKQLEDMYQRNDEPVTKKTDTMRN